MHLTKPTLLIDPKKCKDNIWFMKKKAEDNNISFRPHFKTHQSIAIGKWFKEAGINKITVSSVDMAKYFANEGWEDILIAFPLNINELDEVNSLAKKINLSLTLENFEGLKALEKKLTAQAGIYLKIDAGYGRTGLNWTNKEHIISLSEKILSSDKLDLKGLLVHSGHTYHAGSPNEIIQIHDESIERLNTIKNHLKEKAKDIKISIGDTPGCTLGNNFDGVDEIRPGNFVFYDLQQYKAGVCSLNDIGTILACPVVAKHEERSELIIYGGAVHFSKENIIEGEKTIYGYGVKLNDEDWMPHTSRMIITKLSQEHGTVSVTPEIFNEIKIGDFIGFFPVHACLTANLMGYYQDLNDNLYDHMNGKIR
jgi:D-serine deaminase-like pyridoxal phosphate-dependent protein